MTPPKIDKLDDFGSAETLGQMWSLCSKGPISKGLVEIVAFGAIGAERTKKPPRKALNENW